MSLRHVETVSVDVPIYQRVPVEGNGTSGHRLVREGTRLEMVDVLIDIDKLRRVAVRATRNKNGRSTMADGGLVFVVKD